MKDKILKILKENDSFVSGEEISKRLGVSRTAIWKHINLLREEGYIIESSSKKGYRLLEAPDVLTKDEIIPLLKTKYIGREIVHFESIDSTNNEARKMAYNCCSEGLIIIAEEQTKGRGRMGRRWATIKGDAIAFSLVLRPKIKPKDASGITIVMGIAVLRAIRKVASVDAMIKWPNDIIINNKKVCGMLTEMSAEVDYINHIIIGVGINVNNNVFPDDIKDIATSIFLESEKKISRKELIAEILFEFENLYETFKITGLKNILDEFKSYSVTLGKRVKVISLNESFEGEAIDINDDGTLLIKMDDGCKKSVVSGDVSVRGIAGYV